ncbi:MAG: internal scaffolding protein [Microvirus sp.]|nr:MAG: internal scaffolding protein [Microvirus sp.]
MTNKPKYSFFVPHDPMETAFGVSADGELVPQVSMTKQEFMGDCDINNILAEFKVTGQIRHLAANAAAGVYANLADLPDYQTALNAVAIGNEAFASLPSKLRARFENDPAQFLAFMEDPANQDEIVKLGLAVDTRPPAPPEPPTPPPGPTGGDGGKPPS